MFLYLISLFLIFKFCCCCQIVQRFMLSVYLPHLIHPGCYNFVVLSFINSQLLQVISGLSLALWTPVLCPCAVVQLLSLCSCSVTNSLYSNVIPHITNSIEHVVSPQTSLLIQPFSFCHLFLPSHLYFSSISWYCKESKHEWQHELN